MVTVLHFQKMSNIILYLFVIHLNNLVLGYYFYNPDNQQLFKSSSKNFPITYVRIRRPTNEGVSLKRSQRSSTGYCKEAGFVCNTPFNKTYTAIFECTSDNQCPNFFKCCDQKCFEHKICVQSSSVVPQTEEGTCEKWPYNCQYPYPYAFSYRFRCVYDKQCPQGYKCCQQKCFVHKICSKKINIGNQTLKPAENVKDISANISVELEPPAEIRRPVNVENQTTKPKDEIRRTTQEATVENETLEPIEEIRSSAITTTTVRSWFSFFNSNTKTEDAEQEEVEDELKEEEETVNEEDDWNEEKNEEKEKEEAEREKEDIEEENEENVTESDKEETRTEEPKYNAEELSEVNEDADALEIKETTTATTTTEKDLIVEKITVEVIVTPDPNSIESILLQNTPAPLETNEDPEYEEYYENYGDDEDEDEDEPERK